MKILLFFASLALVAFVGCSDSGDSPTSPPPNNGGGDTTVVVSFASDIAPLITGTGCLGASCHGDGATQGGLSLGSGSYNDVKTASGSHGPIVVVGSAGLFCYYYHELLPVVLLVSK